jgi:hypothetical protein
VTRRIAIALVALATAAVLAGPVTASAAQRFAAPGGAGTACTEANPCDLETAVEDPSVNPGDEVILAGGSYDLVAATLTVDDAITVRPVDGARPGIGSTALSAVEVTANATVRDVDVVVAGGGDYAVSATSGTLERIGAYAPSGDAACRVVTGGNVLMRNSVCLAGAVAALQVDGTTGASTQATLRNVNAYSPDDGGPGASLGILANSLTGGTITVDARNVIAVGETSDVAASTDDSPGSGATVTFASSNFSNPLTFGTGTSVTPAGSAGNQTAEPVFVPGFDITMDQAASSPTVDAGTSDGQLGSLDIDRQQRVQNGTPDIGADEALDTVDPDTAITSGPSGETQDPEPDFTFTSNEPGVTFQCNVDGLGFGSCGPTNGQTTLTGLTSGAHTLEVRAVDGAGNFDETPAQRAFTIVTPSSGGGDGSGTGGGGTTDTDPPETTITKTRVKGDDAKVRFTADEPGSTFECRIDKKPFRSCTSPRTVKNLDDGRHRFRVVATDAAGNTDPSAAKAKIKVD